jgi:uncharacterized protein YejL (UPF0352 family)
MAFEVHEHVINDVRYQIGRMPVKDQFHVARKIAPVVAGLGRGYAMAAVSAVDSSNVNADENLFEALTPVADILSKMQDAEVDYVLNKCLSVVAKWNGQGWTRVMSNGNMMFDDMDLPTMVQLVMEVVQSNLGPSLQGLLAQGSPQEDSQFQLNSQE